eukprot:m.350004 g.350004  ORF g.350004 m.350004 type:complete len:61 (+) comp16156_c0_seq11:224-406(+)
MFSLRHYSTGTSNSGQAREDVGHTGEGEGEGGRVAPTASTNIFASFTRTLTFANGSTAAS